MAGLKRAMLLKIKQVFVEYIETSKNKKFKKREYNVREVIYLNGRF